MILKKQKFSTCQNFWIIRKTHVRKEFFKNFRVHIYAKQEEKIVET